MKHKLLYFLLLLMTAFGCAEKEYLVTISTEYGDMHAILHNETPKHKENFIKLANDGFYDSLLFHRVMEDFMIQGGDPNSRNATPGTQLGTGGPDYTIPAEFNKTFFHKKGALSAARIPDQRNPEKESSGSQFYIVDGQTFTEEMLTTDMNKLNQAAQMVMQNDDSLQQILVSIYQTQGPKAYSQKLLEMKQYIATESGIPLAKDIAPERLEAYKTVGGAPHLDDEYTVFGQVIDGLEIIDKIAAQPVGQNDRPVQNIPFTISVEEVSKAKIEKEYGYTFPEIK